MKISLRDITDHNNFISHIILGSIDNDYYNSEEHKIVANQHKAIAVLNEDRDYKDLCEHEIKVLFNGFEIKPERFFKRLEENLDNYILKEAKKLIKEKFNKAYDELEYHSDNSLIGKIDSIKDKLDDLSQYIDREIENKLGIELGRFDND